MKRKRSAYVEAARRHGAIGTRVVEEFERACDELVTQMQTRESKEGAARLFRASSEELGRAALAAARKKRRA
jgi:hypothetical protein